MKAEEKYIRYFDSLSEEETRKIFVAVNYKMLRKQGDRPYNKILYKWYSHIDRTLNRGYLVGELNMQSLEDYKDKGMEWFRSYEYIGEKTGNDIWYKLHFWGRQIRNDEPVRGKTKDKNIDVIKGVKDEKEFILLIPSKVYAEELVEKYYLKGLFDGRKRTAPYKSGYSTEQCNLCGAYTRKIHFVDIDIPEPLYEEALVCSACEMMLENMYFEKLYWCSECGKIKALNKVHRCESSKGIVKKYRINNKEQKQKERETKKRNIEFELVHEWGIKPKGARYE